MNRNQRPNPFYLRLGAAPSASLHLDPRDASIGGSRESIFDELVHFYNLVNDKCELILAMYP
jgi:hypothetical protein